MIRRFARFILWVLCQPTPSRTGVIPAAITVLEGGRERGWRERRRRTRLTHDGGVR